MEWQHAEVVIAGLSAGVAGLGVAGADDRLRWFVVTRDGVLRGVDFEDGQTFFEHQLPFSFEGQAQATVCASRDGRFIAVVPRYGLIGALVDRHTGATRQLQRDDYHANVSAWTVAIARHAERDVLIVATAWNRLEAFALPTFERLAPSSTESTLDYFWGHASLSVGHSRLASFGWLWHPIGALKVVEVDQWLEGRDDPPPGCPEALLADWWDDEVCWLDDQRLAVCADEDQELMARPSGLAIVEAATAQRLRFFPGLVPGALGFDGERLVSLGAQTTAIDLETGATLAETGPADVWHPHARVALHLPALRGDAGPCTVRWLTGTLRGVVGVQPTVKGLQVLGDALEERGVEGEALAHCRADEPHGGRCWVVEALR
jgi:hypothetical protein